jgi:hypothetical protein
MWTDTTRAQYARADLALPSDLTDTEWAVLEPFFPVPCRVGRLSIGVQSGPPIGAQKGPLCRRADRLMLGACFALLAA